MATLFLFLYNEVMEEELLAKITKIEERMASVEASVEKTRKYIFWSFIVQLAVILLPLIGLMFAIPFLLSTMSQAYNGLL